MPVADRVFIDTVYSDDITGYKTTSGIGVARIIDLLPTICFLNEDIIFSKVSFKEIFPDKHNFSNESVDQKEQGAPFSSSRQNM